MVVFGLDLSHHQDLGLDLAQCRREGIEFIFIKSSEGASFVDDEFAANLAEARAAGQLVAAYHYVRSSAAASDQVALIRRVVPLDVPVILDIEANSGGVALTRDMVNRLRGAGYTVPLLYLPRWYWQQIGSPSLAGLPPLWSSRYPDTVQGSLTDEFADVPASYWTGYGGLGVAVLQFTSSARIAGHAPLDANAFNGTRAQLAALLGGEEDDMAVEDIERMVWKGGNVPGTVAEDTLIARVRDLERMVWAGGPVLGTVDPDSLIGEVRAIAAKVDGLSLAGVDVAVLADALRPLLPTAKDVADELDRRVRDNDPTTGPLT